MVASSQERPRFGSGQSKRRCCPLRFMQALGPPPLRGSGQENRRSYNGTCFKQGSAPPRESHWAYRFPLMPRTFGHKLGPAYIVERRLTLIRKDRRSCPEFSLRLANCLASFLPRHRAIWIQHRWLPSMKTAPPRKREGLGAVSRGSPLPQSGARPFPAVPLGPASPVLILEPTALLFLGQTLARP